MRLARGDVDARDFDYALLQPGRWEILLARLGSVLEWLATEAVPAGIVPLAAVGVILLVTRRALGDPLLVPLSLQLSAYAFACALSAFDPIWHVRTTVVRLSLALFPTLGLVLAARLTRATSGGFPEDLQRPRTT
jgi:hypothetical protein